jgi:hypothetical protein
MTMNVWQFHEFCKGKTGSIYIARNGTVTVVEIERVTYLVNNLAAPCAVVVNPNYQYWAHSIDWAGGFSDYFAMGMFPEENQRIKAEPIINITAAQKETLRKIADLHLRRSAEK